MRKIVLISFAVVLALFLVSFALADNEDIVENVNVQFNNVYLGSIAEDAMPGETVPVIVSFDPVKDTVVEDARIRLSIEDVTVTTDRFDISPNAGHSEMIGLTLPEDIGDNWEKEVTLHVEIFTSEDSNRYRYKINLKRDPRIFEILSVDYDAQVSAGDSVPVSVVVKNIGARKLDDGYLVVSIDELGVSARGYFGDLVAIDTDDRDDAVQKSVTLEIPNGIDDGVYEMTIRVYNRDTSIFVRKLIRVEGSALTQVFAGVKNQDMKAGETKTYDLIIVNSGKDVGVYNIQTVSGTNLDVSAPSVVTVGPDSSKSVSVTVTAASGIEVGAYIFSVNVNGQPVTFGANITSGKVSSGIVALTVVLIVVFVVLLIVLIVLLTRKENPIEEAETSYY